jgi:hypothetical protein
MNVNKPRPSAELADLPALPCRIVEFACVPPYNEEEQTLDPHELSTTGTKHPTTLE